MLLDRVGFQLSGLGGILARIGNSMMYGTETESWKIGRGVKLET